MDEWVAASGAAARSAVADCQHTPIDMSQPTQEQATDEFVSNPVSSKTSPLGNAWAKEPQPNPAKRKFEIGSARKGALS